MNSELFLWQRTLMLPTEKKKSNSFLMLCRFNAHPRLSLMDTSYTTDMPLTALKGRNPQTWGHLANFPWKTKFDKTNKSVSIRRGIYLGASLTSMQHSSPMEVKMVTSEERISSQILSQSNERASYLLRSFSSSRNIFWILSPSSPSGSLTSSLVSPSSLMRERKPSSVMSSCMTHK